jgi:hypothetical protein
MPGETSVFDRLYQVPGTVDAPIRVHQACDADLCLTLENGAQTRSRLARFTWGCAGGNMATTRDELVGRLIRAGE